MSNQRTTDPRKRGKHQSSLEKDDDTHQRPSPPPLHPFQPIYPRPSHPLPPPPPNRTALDPIACHVLDRHRIGEIGPEDRRAREPNSMARMRASVDGHLFAAPADDPLPKYGKHRQRDPYPSPADMASSWRKPSTVHAPAPFRPIALSPNFGSGARAASSPENEVPGFRYLVHPENNPPAGANALPSLGLLRTGSNEPRQEPALAAMPSVPAAPPSTPNHPPPPPPPDNDGEQDMEISDDERSMEDVETSTTPARPFTFGTVTERINYNARKNPIGPLAESPRTVCVFNAFVTPSSPVPAEATAASTPVLTDKGSSPRAPLLRAQSLPAIATIDEQDMELDELFNSPSTSVPSSSSDEDELASSSSDEELDEKKPGNVEARADLVLIPDLGSGKRGPVVTREQYSSSPSFERKDLKEILSDDEESLAPHFRALREEVLKMEPHEVRMLLNQDVEALIPRIDDQGTNGDDEREEEESSGSSIPELVDPDSGSDDGRIDSPEPHIEILAERSPPKGSTTVFTTDQLMRLVNGHLHRLHLPVYAPTTSDFSRFGRLKAWSGKFEYDAHQYKNTEIVETGRPLHDFFQIIIAHAPILLESDKYPAHDAPVTEDELRRLSYVTWDGLFRLTPNSVLPRLFNGEIFREFGPETQERDISLQAAISIVVQRRPGVIACHSLLRSCLLDFNGLGLALIHRHGWKLDTTSCFHPMPKPTIPCLDADENLQFRAINHTLAINGYTVVSCLGDEVLKLRFREPAMIAHMLHHNMLTVVNDEDEDGPSVEQRAMRIPEAGFNFRCPFSVAKTQPFQVANPKGKERAVQSWMSVDREPTADNSHGTTGHRRLSNSIPAPRAYFRRGHPGRHQAHSAPVNPTAGAPRMSPVQRHRLRIMNPPPYRPSPLSRSLTIYSDSSP
ncbi:hypothetical protein DFH06DRAFT_1365766 [Mycena polygramma]|nr:hypothetical protein DFH06DRAFT_1365766 [Mycena polygramma]